MIKTGSSLDVVYATDENYAMCTGISMYSLFENNKSIEKLTVYILDNNVTTESQQKLSSIGKDFNREVKFLDAKNLFSDLASKITMKNTQTITAYACCFLPYMLTDLDKVLYLDGDSLVCGDLSSLCYLDMNGVYAYAAHDLAMPIVREKIGFKQDEQYINSGLLYMNLDEIRRANLQPQIQKFIQEVIPTSMHNDQDVINGVYKQHLRSLPAGFNVITPLYEKSYDDLAMFYRFKHYYTKQEISEALESPIFIHFTASSTRRPWIKGCKHPMKKLWDEYKQKTPWKDVEPKQDKRKLKKKTIDWLYNNLSMKTYMALLSLRVNKN